MKMQMKFDIILPKTKTKRGASFFMSDFYDSTARFGRSKAPSFVETVGTCVMGVAEIWPEPVSSTICLRRQNNLAQSLNYLAIV